MKYILKRKLTNEFGFGGDLGTLGADFSTGMIHVNNGGTHEESPYEGVPMGTDREGNPNLVEENEVIYNDYVFSARLTIPHIESSKDMTLEDKVLKKYSGLTFANAAKKAEKESGIIERPNDPISRRGFESELEILALVLERLRAELGTTDLDAPIANLDELLIKKSDNPNNSSSNLYQLKLMLEAQLQMLELMQLQMLLLNPQEMLLPTEEQLMLLQLQLAIDQSLMQPLGFAEGGDLSAVLTPLLNIAMDDNQDPSLIDSSSITLNSAADDLEAPMDNFWNTEEAPEDMSTNDLNALIEEVLEYARANNDRLLARDAKKAKKGKRDDKVDFLEDALEDIRETEAENQLETTEESINNTEEIPLELSVMSTLELPTLPIDAGTELDATMQEPLLFAMGGNTMASPQPLARLLESALNSELLQELLYLKQLNSFMQLLGAMRDPLYLLLYALYVKGIQSENPLELLLAIALADLVYQLYNQAAQQKATRYDYGGPMDLELIMTYLLHLLNKGKAFKFLNNADAILKALIASGKFSSKHIIGLMANLYDESGGFNHRASNNIGGGHYGLVLWGKGRTNTLKAAGYNVKKGATLDELIRAMIYELTEGEYKNYTALKFNSEEAAHNHILNVYENPKEKDKEKRRHRWANRVRHVKKHYNGPTTTSTPAKAETKRKETATLRATSKSELKGNNNSNNATSQSAAKLTKSTRLLNKTVLPLVKLLVLPTKTDAEELRLLALEWALLLAERFNWGANPNFSFILNLNITDEDVLDLIANGSYLNEDGNWINPSTLYAKDVERANMLHYNDVMNGLLAANELDTLNEKKANFFNPETDLWEYSEAVDRALNADKYATDLKDNTIANQVDDVSNRTNDVILGLQDDIEERNKLIELALRRIDYLRGLRLLNNTDEDDDTFLEVYTQDTPENAEIVTDEVGTPIVKLEVDPDVLLRLFKGTPSRGNASYLNSIPTYRDFLKEITSRKKELLDFRDYINNGEYADLLSDVKQISKKEFENNPILRLAAASYLYSTDDEALATNYLKAIAKANPKYILDLAYSFGINIDDEDFKDIAENPKWADNLINEIVLYSLDEDKALAVRNAVDNRRRILYVGDKYDGEDRVIEGSPWSQASSDFDKDTFNNQVKEFKTSLKKGNNPNRYGYLYRDNEGFNLGDKLYKSVYEYENTPEYKLWTNYVLTHPDDPKVLDYLKILDLNTPSIELDPRFLKLYDNDGNLVNNWLELYKHRRGLEADYTLADGTKSTGDHNYGIYHLTPNTVVTPRERTVINHNGKETSFRYDSSAEDIANNPYFNMTLGEDIVDPNTGDITHVYNLSVNDLPEDVTKLNADIDKGVNSRLGDYNGVINGNGDYDPFPRAPKWPYLTGLGLLVGSLLHNALSPIDYSNADAIINASKDLGRYTPIRRTPLGNYLLYKPEDINFVANLLRATERANANNILDTANGNGTTAMAGLLANNYNSLIGLGLAYRQGYEANRAELARVAEFNRGTDLYNSLSGLEAARANQAAELQSKAGRLEGYTKGYAMRLALEDAKSKALSAGITGIANSLYNYANNKYNLDMIEWGIRNNTWNPIRSYIDENGLGVDSNGVKRNPKTGIPLGR